MINDLAKDVPFISLAIQSVDNGDLIAYMAEQGVDFPVINDSDGQISKEYGVRGVPATFVLDADGEIRFVTTGLSSSWGLRLRLWWVEQNWF